MQQLCDLHVHTHYSDGDHSPKEAIDLAISKGIKYLAITDHDTILAIPEALKYAHNKPLTLIPGIEFSAAHKQNNFHMVGLYFDPTNPKIIKLSEQLTKQKHEKNKGRVEKVNAHFKTNIKYSDIRAKHKGVPNTQHIAAAMLEKNLIKTKLEGIYLLIKGGACYYSGSDINISAKEAIQTIKEAGGLSVFAHPSLYKDREFFNTKESQESFIKDLTDLELDALEIQSSDSTPEDVEQLKHYAKKFNLKTSAGSDFHGPTFPQNILGGLPTYKQDLTIIKP